MGADSYQSAIASGKNFGGRSSGSSQFFEVKTEGFEETYKALLDFANDFTYRETSKNVLVPAVRNSMKLVKSTLKAFAPRSDESTRPNYKDPRAKPHMGDTAKSSARAPNSKDRRSTYIAADDLVLGEAFIFTDQRALAQEFGTNPGPNRSRGTVAQPFLRRALSYTAPAVLDTFEREVAQLIEKYNQKNIQGKT